MTTVLEAARQVVAASPVSFYRYDPAIGAYNSFCQQFVGLMWEKAKGRPTPNSYPSAAAARRDSVRSTTDWRQASPGDIIYLGSNHVGIYEGNGVMISATARSTRALEHLGKSVYRHRVDDYAAMLPPLFISHTNGKRERITEFTGTSPAGGGATPFENGDTEMRAIREPGGGIALVGETTYQYLTLDQWTVESKVWGNYTQLTKAQFDKAIADTQVRRAYLLAGISGSGGTSVDPAVIAKAVEAQIADDLQRLSDQIKAINTEIGAPTPDEIADELAERLKA